MVVNFWYSTCAPCRQEMPAIESVHEALGDKVAFVGLAVRDDAALRPGLRPGDRRDLRDRPRPERQSWPRASALFSFPTTFLVDGDGHIVTQHTGGVTAAQLRKLIDDNLH